MRRVTDKTNDGGSAFPTSARQDGPYGGLSVRDYFAAAALTGLKANPHAWEELTHDQMVAQAWADADAMLRARESSS